MPIGFPAYFEEVRNYSVPTDLLVAAIADTLRFSKWRHHRSEHYLFEVTIPPSIWSNGENLFVDLRGEATISVRSECRVSVQCIDWGKNCQNVNRFFQRLEHMVDFRVLEFQARNVPISDNSCVPNRP